MASSSSSSEEALRCPVCHEVFRDPVVLSCTHSFCKQCVDSWWEQRPRQCPVCRKRSASDDPPVSLVLKNLCESYLKERDPKTSVPLCSLHTEQLKLFCLDHQEPVCLICRDSERHADHKFRPIIEVAQQHKDELQKALEPLKEKLKVSERVKAMFDKRAGYVRFQLQQTERLIKKQFKKLHQFLTEEEEARLEVLRKEEEQKSGVIRVKMEALNKDIATLTHTIRTTEEELKAEHGTFLLSYKAAADRIKRCPQRDDPQLPPEARIDQAKHLGNLSFHVWSKMKDKISYSPVILDPNSTKIRYMFSEDLTGVCVETVPQPERTDFVLGSVGFDSGVHSWDVDVGNSAGCELGVAEKNPLLKGDIQSGVFKIKYIKCAVEDHSGNSSGSSSTLKIPQKIRVVLDRDKGELSFSDLNTNAVIHTFSHPFTGKVFPYFVNIDRSPLRVLPAKLLVKRELGSLTNMKT
ncbi:E3 ubiquitin-protein ligase TRIM35-like [Pholidichthys leucotaenia]